MTTPGRAPNSAGAVSPSGQDSQRKGKAQSLVCPRRVASRPFSRSTNRRANQSGSRSAWLAASPSTRPARRPVLPRRTGLNHRPGRHAGAAPMFKLERAIDHEIMAGGRQSTSAGQATNSSASRRPIRRFGCQHGQPPVEFRCSARQWDGKSPSRQSGERRVKRHISWSAASEGSRSHWEFQHAIQPIG